MGALVGVDGLKIHGVADDMVFVDNAIGAMHVAGGAGDLQRFAAGIALD